MDTYWREEVLNLGIKKSLELVQERLIPLKFTSKSERNSYQQCTADLVNEIRRLF